MERQWFSLVPKPGHQVMETSHCFFVMRIAYNHLVQRYLTQMPLVGYKESSRTLIDNIDPLWVARLICLLMQVIDDRGDLPTNLEAQYKLMFLNLLKNFAGFKELREEFPRLKSTTC